MAHCAGERWHAGRTCRPDRTGAPGPLHDPQASHNQTATGAKPGPHRHAQPGHPGAGQPPAPAQTATGTPNQPSAGWFLISPHPKGSPRARSGTTQSAKSGEPKRLQQFITSSTWDHAAVRRNIARWFAGSQPVEALVVDDTGFAKDGTASPCVARQYSGTLGKVGNCQIGVSVHLVSEHASCAADWRLFCPESWDDAKLDDPAEAARARRRRERAGIPDEVRHAGKWRLALEMIDEMTGPGGWGAAGEITATGSARPVVAADAGYGDNTTFRLELEDRGWHYVLA